MERKLKRRKFMYVKVSKRQRIDGYLGFTSNERGCGRLQFTYHHYSALNCQPKQNITKVQYIDIYNTLGKRFIAGGDNAKHTQQGLRTITHKGRKLLMTMQEHKLKYILVMQKIKHQIKYQNINLDFGNTSQQRNKFSCLKNKLFGCLFSHSPDIYHDLACGSTDIKHKTIVLSRNTYNLAFYKVIYQAFY